MSNFKIGSVYKFTKESLEVRSEIYHMAACPGDLQPMSWKQVASRSCVFLCTRLDEEKNVATLLTQSIQGEIFELAQYMKKDAESVGYTEVL